MKPPPTDPFAFQARVFGAFCDDLTDIAAGKANSCERTEALRHISIETGLGGSSGSHPSDQARSGLGASRFDPGRKGGN